MRWSWRGKYVRLRGRKHISWPRRPKSRMVSIGESCCAVLVWLGKGQTRGAVDESETMHCGRVVGRVEHGDVSIGAWFIVDTTRSRFHGASIAGLVVGAMGVFVFSVALRMWLCERKSAA